MLGASAMAANGLLRYTFGAAFPLFTLQSKLFHPHLCYLEHIRLPYEHQSLIPHPVYQALGMGGATSLFGGISVLMLPIPWILYKWGPALRAKSRYSMPSAQKT